MINSGVSVIGQALDVNVNVFVRVVDKHGRIVQEVSKHNKATNNMTEGIIRFLRGEFNNTFLRDHIDNIGLNEDLAREFIPTHIGIGNIGIDERTGKLSDSISNFPQIFEPSYSDKSLRSEILLYHNQHRALIQKSTKGDSYVSDTYALTVQGYYQFNQRLSSKHTLVDLDGIDFGDEDKDVFTFVFSSDRTREVPQYTEDESGLKCITVTELGLFSGDVDDNGSRLLARLLLDPETPLILSSDDTMIVNWQIGLYSLDDMINSAQQDSTDYDYQTRTTTFNELQWTDISGGSQSIEKDYNIIDLVRLKKFSAKVEGYEHYDPNYDLNGDGKIDEADCTILRRILLGDADKSIITLPNSSIIITQGGTTTTITGDNVTVTENSEEGE